MAAFNTKTGIPVPGQEEKEPEMTVGNIPQRPELISLDIIEDNLRSQISQLLSTEKVTREGMRFVLKSILLDLAEGQLLDTVYELELHRQANSRVEPVKEETDGGD